MTIAGCGIQFRSATLKKIVSHTDVAFDENITGAFNSPPIFFVLLICVALIV